MNFNHLAMEQLSRKLHSFKSLSAAPPPRKGWIQAIRSGLQMPAAALAKRMKISPSSVADLEKSEAAGTITLNSLRRAAEAMDCVVVYSIVPKTSLKEIVSRRAHDQALSILSRVHHTMSLEKQAVDEASSRRQLEELAVQLSLSPRSLWK